MYLIRVNGKTSHNDPTCADCFVPGEPPTYPKTAVNYFRKCLDENFVRIGWPDVGDLDTRDKHGALVNCYDWQRLRQHVRDYLDAFFHIPVGSAVLMPNKDRPGDLCIGTTPSRYYFSHNVPNDPYECAHRIDVNWDTDKQGNPVMYQAGQLGIDIHNRALWGRAFRHIEDEHIINKIRAERKRRAVGPHFRGG